jgi:glycosyltransferase involved in cell wall biosynthesis
VTILEVPGFARRRLGGVLFIAVALPFGLAWGMRSTAFIAIRLTSPATAAALCGFALRRPYLAFTTSSGDRSELRYLLSTRSAGLRRRLLRRAAFLVAQTSFSAAELEQVVPRDRIAVIPNPVKTVTPTPLNGKPRAVYSGRLVAGKGLARLLDAWRTIVEERPDAHLTLVGAGGPQESIEDQLKTTVERDPVLRGAVTFTGWVTDVGEHLRGADVYVLPSLEEGMSNALLEACSWQRVIVASDIPANRAVLGDAFPLLFRAGDTDALIAALRLALTDEDVRTTVVRQVDAIVGKASYGAVAAQVEELLDNAQRVARLDLERRPQSDSSRAGAD